MIKVSINKISEGMVIGSDIKNSEGQVIISSGSRLKVDHIKYLHYLEIESVFISVSNSMGSQVSDIDLQSKAEKRLKSKMHWTPESKFENQLFQLGLNSTMEKINNQ